MVLGFKIKFPNGRPTNFVEKILSGEKLHTLRIGNRWRPGMTIQMATGVRTSDYKQFNLRMPALQYVKHVQPFHFDVDKNEQLRLVVEGERPIPFIYEHSEWADVIAQHDGLADGKELFKWFLPKGKLRADFELHGQIIHWTGLVY